MSPRGVQPFAEREQTLKVPKLEKIEKIPSPKMPGSPRTEYFKVTKKQTLEIPNPIPLMTSPRNMKKMKSIPCV